MPLQAIESDFAVDSRAFPLAALCNGCRRSTATRKLIEKREWVKVHLMCGVKTNVVTAVEITDRYAGDCPQLQAFSRSDRAELRHEGSLADKAYLSKGNLQAVVDNHAMPYIPFKADSVATRKNKSTAPLWKQMFHYYSYNQERFMAELSQAHQRGNDIPHD